jgi:hypothetical protein
MDVVRTITGQIEAIGEPLFAVTLTAVPCVNTPVLLMLHWHGFRHDPPPEEISSVAPRRSPIPSSAMQLNERWPDIGTLDQAMLDAAWQLGAWQLDREERRSCSMLGASEQEAMACRQAFGDDPFNPGAESNLVAETPDRQEMMEVGARLGYVRWQFRPVWGGVWKNVAPDDSLSEDGGRNPPCPYGVKTLVGTRLSRTHYRLGRIDHIILPE